MKKILNYKDLCKLIQGKGNEKSGRLNYMTFSKWLGNSIYMAEGFNLIHDSTKNLLQERFL